LDLLTFNDLDL